MDKQLRRLRKLQILLIVCALLLGGSRLQLNHDISHMEPPRVQAKPKHDEFYHSSRFCSAVRDVRSRGMELVSSNEWLVFSRDLVQ